MTALTHWVTDFNSFLWGTLFLIPLLCGTGLFYTLRLRFVQVRKFGLALRYLMGGASLFGRRADKKGMSSFQALATAIAAQVGTGNVAGTATAMVLGGPGALFWLWLAAFFGMATIFAEAVLAQVYKTTDSEGHVVGGPAW
ncbi:MAG: alanine:cation symporter family protein, partial [Desulfovibrio sp.]|nr:alanine:cation symporter family protein [Desulfovibrio sp.]